MEVNQSISALFGLKTMENCSLPQVFARICGAADSLLSVAFCFSVCVCVWGVLKNDEIELLNLVETIGFNTADNEPPNVFYDMG